ncbi:MAG: DUF2490 domain-containing protein [Salibacteraceae bacterium]
MTRSLLYSRFHFGWRFSLLALLVVLGCSTLQAQELWTGAGLQVRTNQWLSLEYEQQARFEMNYPRYKSIFFEPGVAVRFLKDFKVKLNYRYTDRGRNDRNRVSTDLYYSLEPKKLNFDWKFRARWQRSSEE